MGEAKMVPEVGYWNLRGYAQSIRLLLAHTGTEFVEKRFNMSLTKDNDYDLSEWHNVKYSFGLDFPNCPYYIDADVKLSQSFAIMKHLGRKHHLVPKTEEEKIRVDLTEPKAMDEFKNLQAYLERFRALENISAYMKSEKFLAYPLNGPMASFGGK